MKEWLSVTKLSKVLEIPETTIRRYLNNFEEYFRFEKIGRGNKYHPDSIVILQRIATLYSHDRETTEIKNILVNEYAFAVEKLKDESITIDPPAYDISGKINEFQKKQEEFNKKLLEKFQEQQLYIKSLLDSRDSTIQELKRKSYLEEIRIDRFEKIMAEHKVKRVLKDEAMKLWNKKPPEERLTKVGWFHKKEDINKRDIFINNYIDEKIESDLKRELNLNKKDH